MFVLYKEIINFYNYANYINNYKRKEINFALSIPFYNLFGFCLEFKEKYDKFISGKLKSSGFSDFVMEYCSKELEVD
jgi:hypothetical protein